MPTLFRVLHGPPYRQLRNRVNGTPSFEVVGHHLKRDSRSEFRNSDWNWKGTQRQGCGLADYTGKSRSMRGFGPLMDSGVEWAPSFFSKSLYFIRVASPQKWLGAHAGSPACSLSCEACSDEVAGWLQLPWVR
jgi:hypothetical protein